MAGGLFLGGCPCLGVGSLTAGPAHLKIRLGRGFFKDSLTGDKDEDE